MSADSTICPHGGLRRQCGLCERDDEIARLRDQLRLANVDVALLLAQSTDSDVENQALRAAMTRAHGVIRNCVTAGVLRADLNQFLADEADYAGAPDETSDEPPVIGGKPAPMPTVDDAIAAHVRQIQILCDESGRDPAQWLNDWTAGDCL